MPKPTNLYGRNHMEGKKPMVYEMQRTHNQRIQRKSQKNKSRNVVKKNDRSRPVLHRTNRMVWIPANNRLDNYRNKNILEKQMVKKCQWLMTYANALNVATRKH